MKLVGTGSLLPSQKVLLILTMSIVFSHIGNAWKPMTIYGVPKRTITLRRLFSALSVADQDAMKKAVGYQAVDDYIRSGMKVGLGTGSTSAFAVERLGQKLSSGELANIICVPTSIRTKEQASSMGIPLASLDEFSLLDITIDGADDVDHQLNLVKGGGGALLREKMVASSSKVVVIIVDESKISESLGPKFPIPVEIVQFCHLHTMRQLKGIVPACEPVLRHCGDPSEPYTTDNGNFIIDLHLSSPLQNVQKTARQLKQTVGVIDHGLFIDIASHVLVAGTAGQVYLKDKHVR